MSSDENNNIDIIIQKVGGALSMIFSFLIMRDIFIRYRTGIKYGALTSSIMFQLSFADFFSSFFFPFLGSWMTPRDDGAYMAIGNGASCTAQGFFSHLFYGISCMTNVSLAVAYCLIVRKGWKEEYSSKLDIQLRFLLPPILINAPTCFLALFYEGYNFNGVGECGLKPYPPGCSSSNSNVECTRGSKAEIFQLCALPVVFVSSIITIVAVVILMRTVFQQNRKMMRYSQTGESALISISMKTIWQGIWFIAVYALTWVPWFVYMGLNTSGVPIPQVMSYLYQLTFPTQGVWNALVYFRPRYLADRESNQGETKMSSIFRVLKVSESFSSRATLPLSINNDEFKRKERENF